MWESTEGYSMWKTEKRHSKFGKTGFNQLEQLEHWSITSPKKGQNQLSPENLETTITKILVLVLQKNVNLLTFCGFIRHLNKSMIFNALHLKNSTGWHVLACFSLNKTESFMKNDINFDYVVKKMYLLKLFCIVTYRIRRLAWPFNDLHLFMDAKVLHVLGSDSGGVVLALGLWSKKSRVRTLVSPLGFSVTDPGYILLSSSDMTELLLLQPPNWCG